MCVYVYIYIHICIYIYIVYMDVMGMKDCNDIRTLEDMSHIDIGQPAQPDIGHMNEHYLVSVLSRPFHGQTLTL